MKNKTFTIAWISIGLIEMFLGVSGYIRYCSGGLYIFMFPEQIEIKNILFGMTSVLVGIGIFVNPKQQVKLIYSVPIWVIFFILIGTIQYSINWKALGLIYILIPDYWFIILSIFTLREYEKNQIINKVRLKGFVKSNWLFIVLGGAIINSLIFVLAELFPYEIFY